MDKQRATPPLYKDWFLLGFTTGVAASGARLITNIALDKLGVPTHRFASIASGILLGKKAKFFGLVANKPKTDTEWALGYAGDMFLGGVFGSTLSYIMTKTPPGNEVYKGVIKGVALVASTLTLGRFMGIDSVNRVKPNQIVTMLGLGAVFGGLQGAVLSKWGSSMITQSHAVLTKPVSTEEFYTTVKQRQPSPMAYR